LVSAGFVCAPRDIALLGNVVWSENLAVAGTTTKSAPAAYGADASPKPAFPCFEIAASVECYVSVGKVPDAVNGPRVLVRPGETRNLFCQPGDKLAWATA
jgi:hypothetical protein